MIKIVAQLVLLLPYIASGQGIFRDSLNNSSYLKFGAISLETNDSIIRTISKEVAITRRSNDSINAVYTLNVKKSKTPKEFKNFRSTYFFILSVGDKIHSIQLYGFSRVASFDFFGVNLGSSTQEIRDKFGVPENVKPHEGMKAEIWEYANRRCTFALKSDKVVSIRISR